MDVAVPRTNIREDANGNPVLSFYVQFSSSVFLSANTLAAAVKVGNGNESHIPFLCNLASFLFVLEPHYKLCALHSLC